MDFSGCGNTFNCNHPIAQKLIVECLRYWVREAHVDGSVSMKAPSYRGARTGCPAPIPPVVWQIELDDELADAKVIAEAWTAAGLYQIAISQGTAGRSGTAAIATISRRFVKGDPGLVGAVASRLAGSADIYQERGQLPVNSINFVTCHDGFTLNDLVSYNDKHNQANGEGNRMASTIT